MSQTPHAAIFDLDGTLIDSLSDIGAAMNRVLLERGLPVHSMDRYRNFIGSGARALVQRALGEGRQEQLEAALQEFRTDYARNLLVRTRPYAGVEAMLAALSRRAMPMAVLSNKPDAWTRHIVGRLFGSIAFVAVHGQREGVPRKPDPAAALELATGMGVEPARCAFVGDTGVDLQTAQAAGMISVAVGWGFTAPAVLRERAPDHYVGQLAALSSLLGIEPT